MRPGRLFMNVTMLMLLAAPTAAQTPAKKPSPLEPMRFFVGSWMGVGDGQPGTSAVEREYAFALNDRFLEARNKSTYQPQEENPKGEVHEDRGFVSWDRARRRFVCRQFRVEGFVNQYVADSVTVFPDSIVFRSEAIENIPLGYRAGETYRILSPDEFVERFEMAEPNGEFAVYSESHFRRKKRNSGRMPGASSPPNGRIGLGGFRRPGKPHLFRRSRIARASSAAAGFPRPHEKSEGQTVAATVA